MKMTMTNIYNDKSNDDNNNNNDNDNNINDNEDEDDEDDNDDDDDTMRMITTQWLFTYMVSPHTYAQCNQNGCHCGRMTWLGGARFVDVWHLLDINTFRPRPNGHNFAGNISEFMFLHENRILMQISLKFVPN